MVYTYLLKNSIVNLINQNKPFLHFGDELSVLIEFFIHTLKEQEFIHANPSELEKYCP